jgi:cysteine desulfurase
MRTVYLDNNATTAIAPEVCDAMEPYLTTEYFNPSSLYEQAKLPARAITQAQTTLARILGDVEPDEILFTSCATESNNTAILGSAMASKRKHIITTSVEHPSVLEVCKAMKKNGYDVTFLPVNTQGMVSYDDFIKVLRPSTLLVTMIHANNETGVILPIAEFARITKETDESIIFHTDATQSVGKIPVNLRQDLQHIDMLSLSGHKLHAPKGVGALYIKRGTHIRPYMIGGHQQNGRRGGTENVPYIAGLECACLKAEEHMLEYKDKIRLLRDRLEKGIASIPYVQINGKEAPRLPNTLNISCHCIEGEGILYELNSYGICASSGSACTSGTLEPSHVLRAMNIPFSAIHGSVRFSLSRYTEAKEIDFVLDVFPDIVRRLRRLSPYWDEKNNKPCDIDTHTKT